jgi:hypothetical protein
LIFKRACAYPVGLPQEKISPMQIDLPPQDYRVEGETQAKVSEPIFGPGLPLFLVEIAAFAAMFSLMYYLRAGS